MTETIRIGVTGTGGLGMHLARGFEGVDDTTVHAVADVSEENRNAAGEELNVPTERRYENHEGMLDAESLDGVAIATPHSLHYEQVVAALEREIDTLCEKPLCTDLEDAKDLVRRSEEGEAELMVGYQRHLDPAFVAARESIDERVGDPQFITAEITQDWISSQRGAWRSNPDLSGGGQLYDTGSHLLDVVLWTTDLTPVEVNARMLFDDEDERVDKQAALNIKFENGAVADVGISGDAPTVREHLHVWGEEGGYYVDGEDWDPREITFIDPDGSEHHPNLDTHASTSKPAAFVDLVRNGSEPPATPQDALKVTAVTEAAYESAREDTTVELDL